MKKIYNTLLTKKIYTPPTTEVIETEITGQLCKFSPKIAVSDDEINPDGGDGDLGSDPDPDSNPDLWESKRNTFTPVWGQWPKEDSQ